MTTLTPGKINVLTKSYQLFHLLTVRNKNQHRRSHWWKWFSILRRAIGKLLNESQLRRRKRATARIAYLAEHVVPSCYTAFSALVADPQFSPLGLVLLGELARIAGMLGIVERYNEAVVEEEVMEKEEALGQDTGEELGEVVTREDVTRAVARSPMLEVLAEEVKRGLDTNKEALRPLKSETWTEIQSRLSKKTKKKKKRNTDVIDEMFSAIA